VTETLSIVGAFVATAAWMMRTAMRHQNDIAGRFIHHLEQAIRDQHTENRLFRTAIRELTGAVRKNTQMIQRLTTQGENHGPERNARRSEEKVSDQR
jgi:cbb3-type cytochrome oxidase subunit 3